MKKSFIILQLALPLLCLSLGSCNEEVLNPNKAYVNLGGERWPQSELDKWIYDNFTEPYNMTVKYRWDYNEVDYNKTLVPIDVDKVKPVMNMIKQIWIDPYVDLAGDVFVKKYCPKKFVLIGSPQYNDDGTIRLGEAEGAIKVTMYRLNWLDGTKSLIQEVMKTVHHEFFHILHQQIMYDPEFPKITPSSYVTDWSASANTDEIARDLGFISRYARASSDEDFVETLCRIVIYGRESFDARVAASTEAGAKALRQKEQMVVDYMKNVWGVNMYDAGDEKGLVTIVGEAIDDVVENGF